MIGAMLRSGVNRVIEAYQQFRLMGIGGITRALQFTLLSELGRVRKLLMQAARPDRSFEPIGRFIGTARVAGGAVFSFEHARLEICFLRADLVRLRWSPGTPPIPYALARTEWPQTDITMHHTPDGWLVASDALHITLARGGSLQIADAGGKPLRSEQFPFWRGNEWLHSAHLQPEEHLYGLGERASGLNLRDTTSYLWNSDPMVAYGAGEDPLYLNIPIYLGIHHQGSYLVFYENSYPATFRFHQGQAQAHFEGGMLQYYVMPGPPERAFDRYTELTGRPAMPPRWALGYHQSRFSYDNEAEVRAVANGFLSRDLPLSAIHLDIHYMRGYRVFTVDTRRFPDLAALAHDLEQHGIRLVVILDPGIKRDLDYALYIEGIEQKMFCLTPEGGVAIGPVWPGWCAFPDFSDPRVRAWWGEQYPVLLDAGIRGFWHDMNEPAITAAWGQRTLSYTVRHTLEGRGGDHREVHNLYGLLMAIAGYAGLRQQKPDERPFLLSRSGWAGLQRYAWTWTGDIQSSWEMLRQTVVTVLGLTLSGIPYAGPDIGGFKGAPSDELFLRWFQLAAFLPFFRTHSALSSPRREPWSFGAATLGGLRTMLQLRAHLMPYFYTLAWEAHRSGQPLIRPLFWLDNGDAALWGVADAFLLGDALLVAPVLERGAVERTVVLPRGCWYHFWDDRPLDGPGTVWIEAPLARIPLFVREGSMVPMEEEERLVLHCYPPQQGSSAATLYSDAGDGYGAWRLEHFRLAWNEAGDALVLQWEQEGSYPFPYPTLDIHLHAASSTRAWVDGSLLEQTGPRYTVGLCARVVLECRLPGS